MEKSPFITITSSPATSAIVAAASDAIATRSPAPSGTTAVSSAPISQASPSRPSSVVAPGSSLPKGVIVLNPGFSYSINTREGGRLAIEIKNIGDTPWTIARSNGSSPLTDGIVVDKADGIGETTIYFSWDGKLELTRRQTFSFNLKVGEGREMRMKLIDVMAEP